MALLKVFGISFLLFERYHSTSLVDGHSPDCATGSQEPFSAYNQINYYYLHNHIDYISFTFLLRKMSLVLLHHCHLELQIWKEQVHFRL